jgi:hypothetical protein
MIDIWVTHFGDKYSSQYLKNLEKGIARNYSSDFRLFVKTNCPNRHWDKISFLETDKPRIIMDIDFLITGNLDELFDYPLPDNTLAAFPRWWRNGGCKINGGFYKINPGPDLLATVDKFYSNPELWITYYGTMVGSPGKGEQNFIEDSFRNITLLPGSWLGIHTEGSKRYSHDIHNKYYNSYGMPLMVNERFNSNVKLVHFIYDDNMIEDKAQWIQDLWNTT